MVPTLYRVCPVGSGQLSITPRPRGGDWLLDELAALRQAGIDVLVSMLTPPEEDEMGLRDEAALAASCDIEFIAWPVNDMGVPPNRDVAAKIIERLHSRVRAGASVAIHCRQSIGRASLAAAAILVRDGMDCDETWDLISRARGRPVPETDEQRRWVASLST